MAKIELYHDNFQNFKGYAIPKAQLVIADIPYNLGKNAYASNPILRAVVLNTRYLLWTTLTREA